MSAVRMPEPPDGYAEMAPDERRAHWRGMAAAYERLASTMDDQVWRYRTMSRSQRREMGRVAHEARIAELERMAADMRARAEVSRGRAAMRVPT